MLDNKIIYKYEIELYHEDPINLDNGHDSDHALGIEIYFKEILDDRARHLLIKYENVRDKHLDNYDKEQRECLRIRQGYCAMMNRLPCEIHEAMSEGSEAVRRMIEEDRVEMFPEPKGANLIPALRRSLSVKTS
jgi:hypothetical protein